MLGYDGETDKQHYRSRGIHSLALVLHLKLVLHLLGAPTRLAAPGEQAWSLTYLCPTAWHRVLHAGGAQLISAGWVDGRMNE